MRLGAGYEQEEEEQQITPRILIRNVRQSFSNEIDFSLAEPTETVDVCH